ncbi:MAG TPA: DUF494 family protein [Candidatus Atribacteria bacterium]|nr:DUF494 family protein [Candidatus Atribacteria bacterium]
MDNDSRIKGLIRFIFSYLVENDGIIDEQDGIIEELTHEGYSNEEIEYAIIWVSAMLEKSIYVMRDEVVSDLDSINKTFTRPLHPDEREKFTEQAQGLIYWLTSTGQLSPQQREDMIDIAIHIGDYITQDMILNILDSLSLIQGNKDDSNILNQYYYN